MQGAPAGPRRADPTRSRSSSPRPTRRSSASASRAAAPTPPRRSTAASRSPSRSSAPRTTSTTASSTTTSTRPPPSWSRSSATRSASIRRRCVGRDAAPPPKPSRARQGARPSRAAFGGVPPPASRCTSRARSRWSAAASCRMRHERCSAVDDPRTRRRASEAARPSAVPREATPERARTPAARRPRRDPSPGPSRAAATVYTASPMIKPRVDKLLDHADSHYAAVVVVGEAGSADQQLLPQPR